MRLPTAATPLLPLLLLVPLLTVVAVQNPHLELQPESISKSLGETVYVSCSAQVNDPNLVTSMHWMGPGNREIPNLEGTIETIPDGPGNLGLLIQKLEEHDTGIYNCTAVYAGNQNLHAVIEVKSFESIDFGNTPIHQTPILGTDALIKCTVTSSPSPQVDWLKDNIPLKTDSRHIIQHDGVLILGIEEADEGVYRCRARVARLGALESLDIQVEVHVTPTITAPPENTDGVEKEAVTFQCVAKGKPAPKYSWVDDQSRPLDSLEGYYVDDITGELTIMDLRPDQAGVYRCTASNPAGDAVAEARLRVLTKPKLEQFLNVTAKVADTAEFRCVFSGDPKPEVVFQKETKQEPYTNGINADDRIEVQQTENEHGQRVGIMKIRGVERRDDGLYTCTGRSSGGVTVGWGHITVEFAPTFEDQPQNEFWSWEQEKVNLTCLATSIPNATVQWYLRNREIPKADPNLRVVSVGPVGTLTVNPLDNSYFGVYTCEATNTIGSASNDVTLKQVNKPGPITSARVSKITATTITWSLLEPLDNGGRPITVFLVQYKPRDAAWDQGHIHSWTKGSSYTLDSLMPQQHYSFRFAAKNEVGKSEWSGEKVEQMPMVTVPEEPLIFERREGITYVPYTEHYDLQWKAPLDNGDPIDYFTITYYQVADLSWEVLGAKTTKEVEHPGVTTYTLQGLRADTFYRIELRAHNAIGFSLPAELIFKTANGSVVGAPHTEPTVPMGLIVGIAVAALLLLLILVDVTCFFCKDAGITAALVRKVGSKEKDKEAMLEDGKNNSEKPEINGSSKVDGKPQPAPAVPGSDNSAGVMDGKDKETTEPTETTPMIQGDGGDKAAILKEEEAEAAKTATHEGQKGQDGPETGREELTKDSPV